MQKFFELIPSGTDFQFIANRWRYIGISLVLVAISLASMVFNATSESRGSALNFGIDFAGGSQVRLAFSEESGVGVDQVREALTEFEYEGSSAVEVPDAEHEILLRVKATVSITEAQIEACKAAVGEVGDAKLLLFNHPADGSKIFLQYDTQPDYAKVQKAMGDAGCVGVADRGFGKPDEIVVEYALIGIGAQLRDQMNKKFGPGTVTDIVRSETVGPKVGDQLKVDGVKSLLYAISFIFLYVMVRFDLRFAPGGIIALVHDAILVVGTFALLWKEFNLQIVAAVLTVIGYSINDTIVVFDRVRERVALHRDEPIEQTTNRALNDTLSRTILTSGTTLIVLLAIYFLGTGAIKDFALALIVGIVVGTYSSLYIATPVFLWVNKRFYQGEGHLAWLDEPKPGERPLLAAEAGQVDAYSGRTEGDLQANSRGALPPGDGEQEDERLELESPGVRAPDDDDDPSSDKPRKLSRRRRRGQA